MPADCVQFTPHLTESARSTEERHLTVTQQTALQHATRPPLQPHTRTVGVLGLYQGRIPDLPRRGAGPHRIISYRIVDLKRQNRLKVGTDKPKLKVKMQSVSPSSEREPITGIWGLTPGVIPGQRYCRFFVLTPPLSLFHPNFWGVSVGPDRLCRAGTLSCSVVKLFSKYFNLCEKHTWTSQTDCRHRRLTVATALCVATVASRGKSGCNSATGPLHIRTATIGYFALGHRPI